MRTDGHPAPRRGDHAVTGSRFSSHQSSHAATPDGVEPVIEAGPLPERIEDMPAHLAKHFF
jgi:hypothetical protein